MYCHFLQAESKTSPLIMESGASSSPAFFMPMPKRFPKDLLESQFF